MGGECEIAGNLNFDSFSRKFLEYRLGLPFTIRILKIIFTPNLPIATKITILNSESVKIGMTIISKKGGHIDRSRLKTKSLPKITSHNRSLRKYATWQNRSLRQELISKKGFFENCLNYNVIKVSFRKMGPHENTRLQKRAHFEVDHFEK